MSKVSLHPFCIKNQYENNNILGSDTSELRFGSVQNLYLELETRPLTEPFRMHLIPNPKHLGGAMGRQKSSTTWGWRGLLKVEYHFFDTSIPVIWPVCVDQLSNNTHPFWHSPNRLYCRLFIFTAKSRWHLFY